MNKDLHEEAGLAPVGVNAEGEMEWIGTDKEWRAYEMIQSGEEQFRSENCVCPKCGDKVLCEHDSVNHHEIMCARCAG